MRVRFWGTRGSLPKPGPDTVRYGGNTSCVEVESSIGTRVIIDCGTGLHDLGQALNADGAKSLKGHVLISHMHWDHVQGIPFFAPFFVPGNQWDIYAPRGVGQSLRDTLAGQMQYVHFPISLDDMGAEIRFHELTEGTFSIDDIRVATRYMNHTALTFGYRLEADSAVVIYASDHEPFSRDLADGTGDIDGQDRAHCDFLQGADLVIHDAQYLACEYSDKNGWGHSTVEYARAVCSVAGVGCLALTHHDPNRTDAEIDQIVADTKSQLNFAATSPEIIAAAERAVLEITPRARYSHSRAIKDVERAIAPMISTPTLVMNVTDPDAAGIIRQAAKDDHIRLVEVDRLDQAGLSRFANDRALVIFEHAFGAVESTRKASGVIDAFGGVLSSLVIAAPGSEAELRRLGITDAIIRPFSSAYARTRIRAALLRCGCRWERAITAPNEDQRLAALHKLAILDTHAEERFDRITRLAAAIFNAPTALVSLVDRERQWFKSTYGLDATETSRETSFCAHAVVSREMLVVPDTFEDARFADNPLVTGLPHIRFYAGCPIFVDKQCVGTLCVIDDRPRDIDHTRRTILRDLAQLIEVELLRVTKM